MSIFWLYTLIVDNDSLTTIDGMVTNSLHVFLATEQP